jgi:hypothetical protein
MNIIIRTIAATAIVGSAALGFAGLAGAQTVGGQAPTGPGYSYSPDTHAKPAPTAKPGWHNHHGITHIAHLNGE